MSLFEENTKEVPQTDKELPEVRNDVVGVANLLLSLGQYENINLDLGILTIEDAKQALDVALELQAYKNGNETYKDDRTVAVKSETIKDKGPNETSAIDPRELEWLKVKDDLDYTIKVIKDTGEFTVNNRTTHGFVVESEGRVVKFSTVAKALLPKMIEGAEVSFKRYKDGNYTKYEVK